MMRHIAILESKVLNTITKFLFITLLSSQCASAANYYYDDERGLFFSGEVLYWTATQEGLNYITVPETFLEEDPVTSEFSREYLQHDWAPGFRLDGGYRMGTNNWVIRSAYTYWSHTAKDEVSRVTEVAAGDNPEISNIFKGKSSLDYRTADLVFERPYDFTFWSEMRPFIGFRALWIDQRFTTKTETVPANTISNLETEKSSLFAKGIYAGLDYRWDLSNGFTFWQTSSASLLEGEIKSSHASEDQEILSKNHCSPIAGLSLGTGLGWESCYCLCNTLFKYRIDLGYELNQWFSVTEELRGPIVDDILTDVKYDSIVLHGATLKVSLFF